MIIQGISIEHSPYHILWLPGKPTNSTVVLTVSVKNTVYPNVGRYTKLFLALIVWNFSSLPRFLSDDDSEECAWRELQNSNDRSAESSFCQLRRDTLYTQIW